MDSAISQSDLLKINQSEKIELSLSKAEENNENNTQDKDKLSKFSS